MVAAAGGIGANVAVEGFAYAPADVVVEAGEVVAFEASDFHPLAFDDNVELVCETSCAIVFRTPGEYGFYCSRHGGPAGAGMSGTVTVVASTIEDRVFLDPFELSYD